MRKIYLALGFSLLSGTLFAGGLDLSFFGYRICDVSFDANPFSRDDGRTSGVRVVSCAPQYHTLPPPQYRQTGSISSVSGRKKDEQSIVVRDSSNVTIINHENQRNTRQTYAPGIQTVYPAVQYTYPVTYAYPASYVYPVYYGGYYYRPYRYCGYYPCYGRW